MKKHIPNFITCLNLFAGCMACLMAFHALFFHAFLWILSAAVFDFLDGMAARLLKAYSPLGKELDSLADVVSFGVAPGFIVYAVLKQICSNAWRSDNCMLYSLIPYIAFLIPVFSALRLAKFNIDDRQTNSFIGLPVPANAIFWASLMAGTVQYADGNELLFGITTLLLVLIFSFLLVSEIPMFSLKVKNLSWKDNQQRYVLISASVLAVILLESTGLSVAILLYIFLSMLVSRRH